MEQIGSALAVLIIFSLVLYGSYVCTKKVAKFSYRGNQSRYMKVEDRLTLSQEQYLAVVLVGETHYLIGVASGNITVLSEIKEEDLTEIQPETRGMIPNTSFKDLMTKFSKDKDSKL